MSGDPRGAVVGRAPGKVILSGEHAVVYGYPAIALPLHNLHAEVTVVSASPGYGTIIAALDMQQHTRLAVPSRQLRALAQAANAAFAEIGLKEEPDWILQVRSQIPLARGLGSGAAVVCALVRAVGNAAGHSLALEVLNRIVFESETLFHGRPSGIDNLTVVHGLPLFFRKGLRPQFFRPIQCPVFLLADTGIPVHTAKAVAEVARLKHQHPHRVEAWLEEIGLISEAILEALSHSKTVNLGPLLNANQELLRRLGVSSVANEKLIQAALVAGAPAAKVTGAGMGGQVLVLSSNQEVDGLEEALRIAGATAVRPIHWQAEITANPT